MSFPVGETATLFTMVGFYPRRRSLSLLIRTHERHKTLPSGSLSPDRSALALLVAPRCGFRLVTRLIKKGLMVFATGANLLHRPPRETGDRQ